MNGPLALTEVVYSVSARENNHHLLFSIISINSPDTAKKHFPPFIISLMLLCYYAIML